MSNSPNELRDMLDEVLRKSGLSFDVVTEHADEVIAFGSRALGVGRSDSDYDVLLVGRAPYGKIEGVDIVVVSPADVHGVAWLESELATHIAKYGVWLKGEGGWRGQVRISPVTISDKARRIRVQSTAFSKLLTIQSSARVRHHATRLRRNLQRLALLAEGTAMPTNPELDHAWRGTVAQERAALVQRMLAEFDLGPPTVWQQILTRDS